MIKVIQTGLFTTIQDGGRHGYRNIGIPTSGFMDQESAWAANKIVDNDREESLIEITLKGPTLLFNNNCTISITGGDFSPLINDMPIKMYKSINVKLGDTLKINNTKNGARCYLAISGGINVKSIFGTPSSSTHVGSCPLILGWSCLPSLLNASDSMSLPAKIKSLLVLIGIQPWPIFAILFAFSCVIFRPNSKGIF